MRKSTVLVIDNDETVGQSLSRNRKGDDFSFESFQDAAGALDRLKSRPSPDIVLVAAQLPGAGGLDCAREIKSIADIPIILMAGVDDLDAGFSAFANYAEDFIVKPLDAGELEARIRIALKRMPAYDYAGEPVIVVDEQLSIDFAHNRAIYAGKTISLTPIEATLLRILVRNAPRVVQSHTLLARAWPAGAAIEDTLRVHMHRLRRKLEPDTRHPHYILTERGSGYRFTMRPARLSEENA